MSEKFVSIKESAGDSTSLSAVLELSRIDAEELREEMPEGKVNIQSNQHSSSIAHDAMTVLAVVLLSKDILRILAIFIARQLKKSKKTFSFELLQSDGTKKNITFSSDDIESSSQDKIIEALEKLLGKSSDFSASNLPK